MGVSKKKIAAVCAVAFIAASFLLIKYYNWRPILADVEFSRTFYDKNGKMLRMNLTSDEIYRVYTPLDKIAPMMKDAALRYEDSWFYWHLGINPYSIARAAVTYFGGGGRVLGGSTITMQLARMKYDINSKTLAGKFRQILAAFMLEIRYSKDEILEAYLNLAPYGHNIEGVGAASLIYFGIQPEKLSPLESISLVVIPQNPTARTPTNATGMSNITEARKRLYDMLENNDNNAMKDLIGYDITTFSPSQLPFRTPHLTTRLMAEDMRRRTVKTSIDLKKQDIVESRMDIFIKRWGRNGVKNAAVLLLDYKDMKIRAYQGSADFFDEDILGQVDGVTAKRSPASVTKPFIYALALEQGLIHPKSMIKDAPRRFGTYSPENADKGFMGPLFAYEALVHSRNIPAVDLMLQLEKSSFYNMLKRTVSDMRDEAFYGSALALGGYEATMEEVALLYAALANYGEYKCAGALEDTACNGKQFNLFSPEAAFLTMDMLKRNPKPDGFGDLGDIYWKTGTSYGYRDAWTAGIFGRYVLVVWVGNFDSSGNNIFTGRGPAANLFFSIARGIIEAENIELRMPIPPKVLNIKSVDICSPTGDLPSAFCPKTEKGQFIPGVSPIKVTDIFRQVAINKETGLRACRYDADRTFLKIYEFWPSDIYALFMKSGIMKPLPPPYEAGCDIEELNIGGVEPLITTPAANGYIFSIDEGDTIPLTAVADSGARKLFWFINGKLSAETAPASPFFYAAENGKHTLTVSDDSGRSASVTFSVITTQR